MMSSDQPKPIRRVSSKKFRGLGDVVKVVAAPVAKVMGIKNCRGCDKRQEWLNEKVPFDREG